MTEEKYEALQKDYFEVEDKANSREAKLTQLEHLMNSVLHQVEEVEGIYYMSIQKKRNSGHTDHLTENIDELRSLVEIAREQARIGRLGH